jgi:omega-6 fatty acid desaturase (delta-12 desaturase)
MTPRPTCPPWRETLAPFAVPSLKRGLLALATSVVPYLALSAALYLTLGVSAALSAALIVAAAGFLVRVFVMFHDCTHGSLLPSRRANAVVGPILGLLVLSPFRRWRHDHAVHHATSGQLERRGVGDILTLTVAEYQARGWRGRLAYRLLRSPVVMFGLGPVFAMIVGPRIIARGARPRMRNSVLGTNAMLLVLVGAVCWLIGWRDFLIVWAPPALLAGSVGIWLFYVQHQFEAAYWQSGEDWNYADAALRGSSHLKLPAVLQFFTGNIGLHHVHHLNARIPNYNLPRAHASSPVFATVPTLSLWDGLRAVRFKLWDEQAGRLVTFAQAAQASRPAQRVRDGLGATPIRSQLNPAEGVEDRFASEPRHAEATLAPRGGSSPRPAPSATVT